MTAPPFLTFPVRGKRDAIRARHCARQIAALLHFSVEQQACIAAGTFMIACQGLGVYGKFVLCFQIDNNQLHVHARGPANRPQLPCGRVNRLAALPGGDGETPLRLVKPLPEEKTLAEADVAWLVRHAEAESTGLFEEIIKQNQEVLALVHQLQTLQQPHDTGQPLRPHAA